jgi:hypothetical protein
MFILLNRLTPALITGPEQKHIEFLSARFPSETEKSVAVAVAALPMSLSGVRFLA